MQLFVDSASLFTARVNLGDPWRPGPWTIDGALDLLEDVETAAVHAVMTHDERRRRKEERDRLDAAYQEFQTVWGRHNECVQAYAAGDREERDDVLCELYAESMRLLEDESGLQGYLPDERADEEEYDNEPESGESDDPEDPYDAALGGW
jgi:hypothetical protein